MAIVNGGLVVVNGECRTLFSPLTLTLSRLWGEGKASGRVWVIGSTFGTDARGMLLRPSRRFQPQVDSAVYAQGTLVSIGGTSGCSLSLRERVRVRGNAMSEPRLGLGFPHEDDRVTFGGTSNRTVPSPSPQPSPRGRGSTFDRDPQRGMALRPSRPFRVKVDSAVHAQKMFGTSAPTP